MFQALRRVQVAASDFPRSRRFYGETLELPEIGGFESDWVEFGLGPIILKLVPLRPGEVPARNQVAAVLSTDALDAVLSSLKERGVTVTRGPLDEFTGRYAEILDPDGYRLVVFQPSDLHPDEEWVPMSHVDETVKQKLLARRQKDRAKASAPVKPVKPVKKAAPAKKPAKAAGKPKAKPEAKKPAKKADAKRPDSKKPKAAKAAKGEAKKPAPKKAAPAKAAEKKAAPAKKAEKKPAKAAGGAKPMKKPSAVVDEKKSAAPKGAGKKK
jgi:predicted enzyme related to lactoylglutathione lyase